MEFVKWRAMGIIAIMCLSLCIITIGVGQDDAAALRWSDPTDTVFYMDPNQDVFISGIGHGYDEWEQSPWRDTGQNYTLVLYNTSQNTGLFLEHIPDSVPGWRETIFGLTDPPHDANDWYGINIVLGTYGPYQSNINTHFRFYFGFSYNAQEEWAPDPAYPVGPNGGSTIQWNYTFWTNPETNLPWRADELKDLRVRVNAYANTYPPGNIYFERIYVGARLATAPVIPTSGFEILRPDGDIETECSIYPGDGAHYSKLNEHTVGSDKDTTYVCGAGTDVYSFSDMQSPDTNDGYAITLWIFGRMDTLYDPALKVRFDIEIWRTPYIHSERFSVSTAYRNYSFTYDLNPWTNQPWTRAELNNLVLAYSGESGLRISQIAVLVRYSAGTSVPPLEEVSTWPKLVDWFRSGGVITMFGVMGFFGMIAVPALTYVAYRNGEDALESVSKGVWLFVLFLGCFLVGLIGA